jgi:hypothetical protein
MSVMVGSVLLPIGDARKTLEAFAQLLKGSTPANVEKWDKNLLP